MQWHVMMYAWFGSQGNENQCLLLTAAVWGEEHTDTAWILHLRFVFTVEWQKKKKNNSVKKMGEEWGRVGGAERRILGLISGEISFKLMRLDRVTVGHLDNVVWQGSGDFCGYEQEEEERVRRSCTHLHCWHSSVFSLLSTSLDRLQPECMASLCSSHSRSYSEPAWHTACSQSSKTVSEHRSWADKRLRVPQVRQTYIFISQDTFFFNRSNKSFILFVTHTQSCEHVSTFKLQIWASRVMPPPVTESWICQSFTISFITDTQNPVPSTRRAYVSICLWQAMGNYGPGGAICGPLVFLIWPAQLEQMNSIASHERAGFHPFLSVF